MVKVRPRSDGLLATVGEGRAGDAIRYELENIGWEMARGIF
jgi:hypothetical protein